MMPRDIVTNMACTYFTADNPETPSNSSCYVVQELMTLYLRESSALTSTLQSYSEALKMILDAMNKDDPSPFFEESGDQYSVHDIKGVRYLKGTPDEGGIVLIDNSSNQDSDSTGKDVDGAEDTANNATDACSAKSLSTLGVFLVAIGEVAIIGTVVTATLLLNKRKWKRGEDSKYAEFFDDGNDLEMKHDLWDVTTEMDAFLMRDGTTPISKRSRQLDWEDGEEEEDSVFLDLDVQGSVTNKDHDPTFVHTPMVTLAVSP